MTSDTRRTCPFSSNNSLLLGPTDYSLNGEDENPGRRTVPGQPLLSWDDHQGAGALLELEILTPDLDAMAPHMWMMATQSSANINALHRQLVKGRRILVTEDPQLHLVWLQDRIHIKPLPKFLLSYDFWNNVLLSSSPGTGPQQSDLVKASLGYLRSYRHLIQHESDLRIAQQDDLQLVPKEASWEQVIRFLSELESIHDDDVSPRYAFGELRLSRLNFYGKFFLRRFHFERLYVQYGSYFGQFYAPLLFTFGLSALTLNSLQVELTVEQLPGNENLNLQTLGRLVAVTVLVWVIFVTLILVLLFLYLFVDEWQYAIRYKVRSTRRKLTTVQKDCE